MPQRHLRLDIDMDADVVLRDKHAGTNPWSLKGSDDLIDWRGEDVSFKACLDVRHLRAADVAG
jgi:hypothetical protein